VHQGFSIGEELRNATTNGPVEEAKESLFGQRARG
jgi:hypothetical protein